jgi:hypothetical protein
MNTENVENIGDETVTNQVNDDLNQNEEIIEDGSYPAFDESKLTEEEKERMDEIKELIRAETLDSTTAMNILVNAVQVSYDKKHFNDLDRYLIVKALTTFKLIADTGEDIVIKTV